VAQLKGKVLPYSLPSVGPGADRGVQAVSPQVTFIHLAVDCHYFPVTSIAFTRWCHQYTVAHNSGSLFTYQHRKDERLSWLTCSEWFTHNSGYPAAAGRAWDRESSPNRADVLPLCRATNVAQLLM